MAEPRQPRLRGVLRENEPMARHTTWRVGGRARCFYTPADLDDLRVFINQLDLGEELVWLGLGSNLLVRDGGLNATVISTGGALGRLTLVNEGVVRAEAGVACAKVARFCATHDLIGAEFFAGIPGTLGGALAMNAGAFGGETWGIVETVETIDASGHLYRRAPAEYQIGYRNVVSPRKEWFAAVYLKLAKGDGSASLARIKELLERRNETQPIGFPTCGSVFRNPPGDFAGSLIEACGLKGYCIGGACVSKKHANFIINTGKASAADIEHLIEHVAATVMNQRGVALTPEVRIIGEAQA